MTTTCNIPDKDPFTAYKEFKDTYKGADKEPSSAGKDAAVSKVSVEVKADGFDLLSDALAKKCLADWTAKYPKSKLPDFDKRWPTKLKELKGTIDKLKTSAGADSWVDSSLTLSGSTYVAEVQAYRDLLTLVTTPPPAPKPPDETGTGAAVSRSTPHYVPIETDSHDPYLWLKIIGGITGLGLGVTAIVAGLRKLESRPVTLQLEKGQMVFLNPKSKGFAMSSERGSMSLVELKRAEEGGVEALSRIGIGGNRVLITRDGTLFTLPPGRFILLKKGDTLSIHMKSEDGTRDLVKDAARLDWTVDGITLTPLKLDRYPKPEEAVELPTVTEVKEPSPPLPPPPPPDADPVSPRPTDFDSIETNLKTILSSLEVDKAKSEKLLGEKGLIKRVWDGITEAHRLRLYEMTEPVAPLYIRQWALWRLGEDVKYPEVPRGLETSRAEQEGQRLDALVLKAINYFEALPSDPEKRPVPIEMPTVNGRPTTPAGASISGVERTVAVDSSSSDIARGLSSEMPTIAPERSGVSASGIEVDAGDIVEEAPVSPSTEALPAKIVEGVPSIPGVKPPSPGSTPPPLPPAARKASPAGDSPPEEEVTLDRRSLMERQAPYLDARAVDAARDSGDYRETTIEIEGEPPEELWHEVESVEGTDAPRPGTDHEWTERVDRLAKASMFIDGPEQALILRALGDLSEALKVAKETEKTPESHLTPDSLARINRALSYMDSLKTLSKLFGFKAQSQSDKGYRAVLLRALPIEQHLLRDLEGFEKLPEGSCMYILSQILSRLEKGETLVKAVRTEVREFIEKNTELPIRFREEAVRSEEAAPAPTKWDERDYQLKRIKRVVPFTRGLGVIPQLLEKAREEIVMAWGDGKVAETRIVTMATRYVDRILETDVYRKLRDLTVRIARTADTSDVEALKKERRAIMRGLFAEESEAIITDEFPELALRTKRPPVTVENIAAEIRERYRLPKDGKLSLLAAKRAEAIFKVWKRAGSPSPEKKLLGVPPERFIEAEMDAYLERLGKKGSKAASLARTIREKDRGRRDTRGTKSLARSILESVREHAKRAKTHR